MTILVDGNEYIPTGEQAQAASVEMWYYRHYRHWVIYPVNADGTQIAEAEAQYGFGKREALRIKAEVEAEYNI